MRQGASFRSRERKKRRKCQNVRKLKKVMLNLPKIIAIIGPTASGKTDLGIFLAKKFNGEVLNFDSRQIYTKMDIGTAKPVGEWQEVDGKKVYVVEGVVHHLMDFVDPGDDYSLGNFKADAFRAIDDILSRGKLPILVGGTGLYFWGVIDNLDLTNTEPDKKLREQLESKTLVEQVEMLKEKDPESAAIIDLKNPRRVLRALEVVLSTGGSFIARKGKADPRYDALQIGLLWDRGVLNTRIDQRAETQIKDGLLEETKKLAEEYPWPLPSMSGIGYRQMGYYLRGEMSLPEAVEVLKRDTRRYAKRQMTWFKRDQRIIWIDGPDKNRAEELVREFLV